MYRQQVIIAKRLKSLDALVGFIFSIFHSTWFYDNYFVIQTFFEKQSSAAWNYHEEALHSSKMQCSDSQTGVRKPYVKTKISLFLPHMCGLVIWLQTTQS